MPGSSGSSGSGSGDPVFGISIILILLLGAFAISNYQKKTIKDEANFTVEVEGNDYDYSFSQCTVKECIHPDWKCPCDDVSNLGDQQSVVR